MKKCKCIVIQPVTGASCCYEDAEYKYSSAIGGTLHLYVNKNGIEHTFNMDNVFRVSFMR